MHDRYGKITLQVLDCVAFSSSSAHAMLVHVHETVKFPQRKWKGERKGEGREREREGGMELLLKKVPMSFGTSPFGGSRSSPREGLKIRRLLRKIQLKLGLNFTRKNNSI